MNNQPSKAFGITTNPITNANIQSIKIVNIVFPILSYVRELFFSSDNNNFLFFSV